MKIKIISILNVFALLFQIEIAQAQNALKGNLNNYTDGAGKIVSHDMISGNMHEWGSIDPSGKFSINLPGNFMESLKIMAEEAQKNAPSGFRMQFKTVEDTFVCQYDPVDTEGGETIVAGMPELSIGDQNGDPVNGILYAVSNPEIAYWLFNYGDGDISPGYYLQFYFVEAAAKAKGDCLLEIYTGNGEEFYEESIVIDLNLKEGWNIIRYGFEDVFTSSSGKVFPSKMTTTRLESLPEDLIWVQIKP
jgi:hypothetical protein